MPDRIDRSGGVGGTRGILYPTLLPTFARFDPPAAAAGLVRWFWLPEWDLPEGQTSRQHVIAFPASNLVVDEESVTLFGPTSRKSHRDLTGRGWVVGALLRPAAVRRFTADPAALVDGSIDVAAEDLREEVAAAMAGPARHERAVGAFSRWLVEQIPTSGEEALLANEISEIIEADPSLLRIPDVAARVGTSVRTLQRVCRNHIGLPPMALIRRRRLQEAAEALRVDPGIDLAGLAAELGYADHAHLSRDFRAVLGFTPSTYRSADAPGDPG